MGAADGSLPSWLISGAGARREEPLGGAAGLGLPEPQAVPAGRAEPPSYPVPPPLLRGAGVGWGARGVSNLTFDR